MATLYLLSKLSFLGRLDALQFTHRWQCTLTVKQNTKNKSYIMIEKKKLKF